MGNTVEWLTGGTPVYTSPAHGFGTDGLLLARFRQPGRQQRTADLCSGCGIVALEWHDRGHRGPCAAVELSPQGTALCQKSAAQAAEGAHIQPLCADLRLWRPAECGRFDLVACNPPYFTGGPPSPQAIRAGARHEGLCTLPDVADCAFRLLRDGGRLTLVQKPSQLARVCAVLSQHRLEPKRLALVRAAPGRQPCLFLVEAQKNRRPGLILEPDILLSAGASQYGPPR